MATLETGVHALMNIPCIVNYCIQKGISLITCSDVFPDILGKLLEIRNVPHPESFINDLNDYLKSSPENKLR